jgi:hypothetical protein
MSNPGSILVSAEGWLRDVQGRLKAQTVGQHGRALDLLAEFVVMQAHGGDPKTVLTTTGMEHVTRRRAAEFMEWLQQTKALHPKAVGRLHSSLSTFWK